MALALEEEEKPWACMMPGVSALSLRAYCTAHWLTWHNENWGLTRPLQHRRQPGLAVQDVQQDRVDYDEGHYQHCARFQAKHRA